MEPLSEAFGWDGYRKGVKLFPLSKRMFYVMFDLTGSIFSILDHMSPLLRTPDHTFPISADSFGSTFGVPLRYSNIIQIFSIETNIKVKLQQAKHKCLQHRYAKRIHMEAWDLA